MAPSESINDILKKITKENVISAIEEIDRDGFDKKYKATGYLLEYEWKLYPPKYTIMIAHKYVPKGQDTKVEPLKLKDFSGGDQANNTLSNLGLNIIDIGSKFHLIYSLYNFLEQSQTEDRRTVSSKSYIEKYRGLRVELSFAQGRLANVTWVGFLNENNKIRKGIYPLFLYERESSVLYLAFGVSEEEEPTENWPESVTKQYNKLGDMDVSPLVKESYPKSFYYREYPLNIDNIRKSMELNEEKIFKDLNEMIDIYMGKETGEGGTKASNQLFETMEDLLSEKRQIILYGPPGTSKTYFAKQFVTWFFYNNELNGDVLKKGFKELQTQKKVDIVQFHPSYSYEEFIEGIRPLSKDNTLRYDVVDGIFKKFCKNANVHKDQKFIFIIDEINRGNIAKIFGELIYALEYRDEKVKLQYSEMDDKQEDIEGKYLEIPSNVFIIGTMNTADRSIALLDIALRRRFAFVPLMPNYDLASKALGFGEKFDKEQLKGVYESHENDGMKYSALSLLAVESLNKRISSETRLGREKQIGHTFIINYFNGNRKPDDAFILLWKYEILPLLEEYFYYDYGKISGLFGRDGSKIVSKEHGINDFGTDELREALVNALMDKNDVN